MKKPFTYILIFCFANVILLSSCAEEDSPFAETAIYEQTAEDYLAHPNMPAILFSYNVYSPETDILTSWMIDTDGQIRTAQKESDALYEGDALSPYYMDGKKSKSVATTTKVDLDELVKNFKQLSTAQNLPYNQSAETKSGDQQLTAVYGYYYKSVDSDDQSCNCSTGSTSSVQSLQLYQPVLLQQKVGNEIIQTSSKVAIVDWMNLLNIQAD